MKGRNVFAAAMLSGALFAAHSVGAAHIVPGAVAGILLGVLVSCLLPRW